jgi:KilA-N domain
MTNNSVLTHSFGNSLIQQRESDGYINATAMCKATGKLWADYFRLDSTAEFLQELSTVMGYPITALYQVFQGGNNQSFQGTWIHPYIAINLAQWCSAAFAVQVSKWVIDWFKGAQNPISQSQAIPQNDEIRRLELALALADRHGIDYATLALGGQPPVTQSHPQPCEAPPAAPQPREKAQLKAKAWVEILETRDRWAEQNKDHRVVEGDLIFCQAYNERRLYIGGWVYKAIPTISRATLARRRGQGSSKEAQLGKEGAGRPLLIDSKFPAIAAFIAKCLESSSSIRLPGLMKLIEVEFKGLDLPCEATIRRYLAHRKASKSIN